METHAYDPPSNESESIESTKSSTVLNFSVDSILNSSSGAKKVDDESKRAIDLLKSSVADDCSRIYRPMPMRYVSNSTHYQGNNFH